MKTTHQGLRYVYQTFAIHVRCIVIPFLLLSLNERSSFYFAIVVRLLHCCQIARIICGPMILKLKQNTVY